jgi:hypothetical protein
MGMRPAAESGPGSVGARSSSTSRLQPNGVGESFQWACSGRSAGALQLSVHSGRCGRYPGCASSAGCRTATGCTIEDADRTGTGSRDVVVGEGPAGVARGTFASDGENGGAWMPGRCS